MCECHGAVGAHDADGAVGGHEPGAGRDAAARRQRRVDLRCHGVHDARRRAAGCAAANGTRTCARTATRTLLADITHQCQDKKLTIMKISKKLPC